MKINKLFKKMYRALTICVSVFKHKHIVPIVQVKDKILTGRVALIIGGSGGIGFAIAKTYIASGCKVIIAGTNVEKLSMKAKELGVQAAIIVDMNDVDSFNGKIKEAASIYGTIDTLVCCSGVHVKRQGSDYMNVTPAEYDYIMDVNLKGTYFICQSFANYMIENNQRGNILLISSSRGAEPAWSPYGLSKASLDGLTKGLAQILTPYGVIVNSIAPGPTATAMQEDLIRGSIYTNENSLGRYTTPEEVAEIAKILVSEVGQSIIGDTIYISAGRGVFDIR